MLIDGRHVNLFLTLPVMHDDQAITTIEDLYDGQALDPMQAAFQKHDGFQYGHCMPGQISSPVGMPSEACAGMPSHVAKCQAVGATIPGVNSALKEAAILDSRYDCFVRHDLAGYHVSAPADLPAFEAQLLPELDDKTNPLKIKDVGEFGIPGARAALANAVCNACGVGIRDCPSTLDKVLAGLSSLSAG